MSPPISYNRKTLFAKPRKSSAVFSKLVSVADHPAVRRGVAEDMKRILRKPSQNDSHHWNNAPRNETTRSSDRFDPKRIRMPGRGLSFLRPKDQMIVRRASNEDDEAPPSPKIKNYDLFNNFNDIIAEAGLIPKQMPPPKKRKIASGKVRFNNAKKAFEIRDSDEEADEERTRRPRSKLGFNDVLNQMPKQSQAKTRTQFFDDVDDISPIAHPLNPGLPSDEDEVPDMEEEQPEEERGFSILDPDFYLSKPNAFGRAKKMPETFPEKEIIARTAESLPRLSLRNGNALTYGTLVGDTCRKLLLCQKEMPFDLSQRFHEDETTKTPMKFMDHWNVTVHQAAVDHSELMRSFKF